MSTIGQKTIQVSATDQTSQLFEEGAKRLNLTPNAFFAYLVERTRPDVDVARFDRHVRDVFGKHGELIRRLAK